MSIETRVDARKLEIAANMLKAVAHPARLSVVDLLDQIEELNVSELQEKIGIEQALLSHHLTQMRDKGLLKCRREGKNMYYSLADKHITGIIHCIYTCKLLED
jgi:DNA-binding transcriptional ArsR family regulator